MFYTFTTICKCSNTYDIYVKKQMYPYIKNYIYIKNAYITVATQYVEEEVLYERKKLLYHKIDQRDTNIAGSICICTF